jgi:hypothetical protein
VPAAAYFADIEKRNFSLMHWWNILKDELKWIELKRRMDDKPGLVPPVMPPLKTQAPA